jgi:hypothetical protein
MNDESVKKSVISNKPFRIAILIFIIVALFFYFKLFFSTGIRYDDTFLKKEVKSSESHYSGKNKYGRLHITVKKPTDHPDITEVTYQLPNNILQEYAVEFGKNAVLGQEIKINDKNGNIIVEGVYRKESYFLYDTKGQPLMDDYIQVIINGESPYNSDYKVSLKNVADLANFSTETIRGRYYFLIFAVIFFAITIIDVKFPLFFFTLSHFIDVKNPEPSDFYINMQKTLWFVYPIIGIVLMIVAII